MTTRHALGRHRATPVRSNPLESISKAVSSNAGSVGRQAAVIAAASGLVLSIGVPAQATPATREADKAPVADVLQADLVAKKASVQAPAAVTVKLGKKDVEKAEKKFPVSGVKAATDGADYRAAKKAQREAAEKATAERQEAAQEAAADRAEAQEAAADRAEAQEAAAERRQAASNRQASTESASSNSSSSSSSNSNSNDGSDGAAMTRESRSGSTSNTTTTASTPKKETKKETKSAPSSNLGGIAGTAASYKGAPYAWGGESPSGWDCSGFVKYVYAKHGISVPHGTSALRSSGKFAQTSSPKPGDLVFQNGGSHVGIYIGGGKIVGAQNPSVGTVERPANSQYGPLTGYYTYVG